MTNHTALFLPLSQLTNLLKKWQHYEKNNYVVRDFIANKEVGRGEERAFF